MAEEMSSEAGVCRPGGDGVCGIWVPGLSVDTRGLWEGREAGVGWGVQTSRVSFLGASRRTRWTCSPSSGRAVGAHSSALVVPNSRNCGPGPVDLSRVCHVLCCYTVSPALLDPAVPRTLVCAPVVTAPRSGAAAEPP